MPDIKSCCLKLSNKWHLSCQWWVSQFLFFLGRSCCCMIWVFQFKPVKAKFNHRVAEIHFSYSCPVDHLQTWLVCVLVGNPTNERRISSTNSTENDCSHVWVMDSKASFCSVCDGNSAVKGHLFWHTDVRKSLSLCPFSDLTHFSESLSNLCCFLSVLKLLYLFSCMYRWKISPSLFNFFAGRRLSVYLTCCTSRFPYLQYQSGNTNLLCS